MGWSEWPAWVKGGVIGILIVFLMLIIYLSSYFLQNQYGYLTCPPGKYFGCGFNNFGNLLNKIKNFLEITSTFNLVGYILIVFFGPCKQIGCLIFFPITIIILIIEYFIIGALIGFIIGKIKSRNEVQYKNV